MQPIDRAVLAIAAEFNVSTVPLAAIARELAAGRAGEPITENGAKSLNDAVEELRSAIGPGRTSHLLDALVTAVLQAIPPRPRRFYERAA